MKNSDILSKSLKFQVVKSVLDKIQQTIKYRRKGSIFFASDFLCHGSLSSVNKALSELAKSGLIIRIATGIYCKPEIDSVFGLGIIYPGLEEIAAAIAERDGARIVPTGAYAQNRLGLSTQIPMNAVYLTDGPARRVQIYNGKGILFKRVSPKHFQFKSKVAMMVTLALKDLGEGNLDIEQEKRLKEIITKEPLSSFIPDFPLMPEWIRSIIKKMYD